MELRIKRGAFFSSAEKKAGIGIPALQFNLAATYSRGSYTTTTIGNAAFDGRVRDGNRVGPQLYGHQKIFASVTHYARHLPTSTLKTVL